MVHRGHRLVGVKHRGAGQAVTDRVSSWLPDPVTGVFPVSPLATFELRAGPNPARTRVRFFSPQPNVALEDARVHDVSGRIVRSFAAGVDLGAGFTWDLRDDSGRRVGAGVYWLHGRVSGRHVARSVTVLDPR